MVYYKLAIFNNYLIFDSPITKKRFKIHIQEEDENGQSKNIKLDHLTTYFLCLEKGYEYIYQCDFTTSNEDFVCDKFGYRIIKTCLENEIFEEIRNIEDDKHPFKKGITGSQFTKYSRCLLIKTTWFKRYLWLKECPPKHKRQIEDHYGAKNNAHILINGTRYRVMKGDEDTWIDDAKSIFTIKEAHHNDHNQAKYSKITIFFDFETIQRTLKHEPYCMCGEIYIPHTPYKINPRYPSPFTTHKIQYETNIPLLDIYEHDTIEYYDYDFDALTPTIRNQPDLKYSWFFPGQLKDLDDSGAKLFFKWVNQWVNWIFRDNEQCASNIELRLIGFNNNNFDNHFIYETFQKCKGYNLDFHEREGKVTTCVFSVHRKNFFPIRVSISDLTKFLTGISLKKACQDFGLSKGKLDFNVVKYNHDCIAAGNFITLVQSIGEIDKYFDEPITEEFGNKFFERTSLIKNCNGYNLRTICEFYCQQDVTATKDLFLIVDGQMRILMNKLKTDHNVLTKYRDFMSYISAPQLAFDVLQGFMFNAEDKLLSINDTDIARDFYKTLFGGICDFGIIGEYNACSDQGLTYADVTSEYPTAMKGYYPDINMPILVGDQINYDEERRIIKQLIYQRRIYFDQCNLNAIIPHFKSLKLGMLLCNISPPENECEHIIFAPVATRIFENSTTLSKLSYQNLPQKEKVLTTIQIRTLIYAGWDVQVLDYKNSVIFTGQKKIFEKYVNVMGLEKTLATNKCYKTLAKLFLNSPYGRLCLKPTSKFKEFSTLANNDSYTIEKNKPYVEEDWSKVYYYLSSMILAWSKWIIYSKLYQLQLSQMYAGHPLSYRVGGILYCDTDSVTFDPALCDVVNFEISEFIGGFDDETCDFKATWKFEEQDKQGKNTIHSIMVLAKKSYILLDKDKNPIAKHLKGIHKAGIKHFDYPELKKILDTQYGSKSIEIATLSKSSTSNSLSKTIFECLVKKTLSRFNCTQPIKSTNDIVNYRNFDNIHETVFDKEKNINNYLVFTSSLRDSNNEQYIESSTTLE